MSVFARFDRHAGLMDRMADTLGVDLAEVSMKGDLSPAEYHEAVFRCTGCTEPQACAAWTEAHAEGAAKAPDYCRNGDLLARLRGWDV